MSITNSVERPYPHEMVILPIIADCLTVAEWALDGTCGPERIPKNKLMLALGAILEDATGEERQHSLGKMSAAARVLWRLVGKRQYAARCRELRRLQAG